MIENFDRSLLFVLADEGKFSDIPGDRGGATNLGITLRTLIDYHSHFDYGDFDHDGDIDVDDIRLLDTPEEAAPIYRKWFWDAVKGDELPSGVDYAVFDSAVNHGPRNAGRFLQRAANRQRGSLTTDGVIGPETLRGVDRCESRGLICDILRERDIFYRKIVAQDPSQGQFLRGWLNRLAKVDSAARSFS